MAYQQQQSQKANEGTKLRIVCLHGFSCNNNIMKFQTSRLRRFWSDHLRQNPIQRSCPGDLEPEIITEIDFLFLESPRILQLPTERALSEVTSLFPGPYRTWFEPHETSEYGRRVDRSLESWLLASLRRIGRVDGILAFSDGGALISSLTLKAEMGLAGYPLLWDFLVLVCAVDPYLDSALHVVEEGNHRKRTKLHLGATPSVHIIGLRDEVYRERSEALWGTVHLSARSKEAGLASVYRFDDGHKVPSHDADLTEVLSSWRRVVLSSGLYQNAS